MFLAISSHGKDGEEWVCRRNQVCCLKHTNVRWLPNIQMETENTVGYESGLQEKL